MSSEEMIGAVQESRKENLYIDKLGCNKSYKTQAHSLQAAL